MLSAGAHSIIFEIGDVNDSILDSAAFITNFHAGPGPTGTTPPGPRTVPEPTSVALFAIGLAGLTFVRRRSTAS